MCIEILFKFSITKFVVPGSDIKGKGYRISVLSPSALDFFGFWKGQIYQMQATSQVAVDVKIAVDSKFAIDLETHSY